MTKEFPNDEPRAASFSDFGSSSFLRPSDFDICRMGRENSRLQLAGQLGD